MPLITIVIGCFVMKISFAIMDGFSNEIAQRVHFFDKEQSIKINKKIFSKNNSNDLDSLIHFLIKEDYFFNAYEDRFMFIDNNINKASVRVYGIVNFNDFNPDLYLLDQYNDFNDSIAACYLGYSQSSSLNIESGEIINLYSILDFENLNSFPSSQFKVKNVIKTHIPRYDNSLFIKFDSILFSKNIFLNINLKKEIDKIHLDFIDTRFGDGLNYNKSSILFADLFYAINFEKLFYGFFGLFIILISSIMIMGFNISSIIRNISSIGLLESIGFQKKQIAFTYLIYSLFISLFGFLISMLMFKFLLFMDHNYNLMEYIFDPNIYFNFNLSLNNDVLINIFLLDIILVFLSTMYPLYKISKLDIIDSIKGRV